ncbi:MAG: formimidoylglutamase [Bacteroidales bacterium]|nr:formimidoylglutamase [Lentimicrobiaceae bacterium]MDD5694345.1 formimidoylglutamase [Bacteroidales bacterium]
MDISIYFEPVHRMEFMDAINPNRGKIGDIIHSFDESGYFPELSTPCIALLGVNEDRQAQANQGCGMAPDYIREKLYNLYAADPTLQILDLGNIKAGFGIEDTFFALKSVVAELVKRNIIPIILGGSQDLTYANYTAYESLGQIVNIVTIDKEFDIGSSEESFDSRSYISKIILHKPNFLFNLTNIGYQTYFVDQDAIRLMKNLFFDVYRLGEIRADLQQAEPLVRNADLLSVDISSVRSSDAPGCALTTPNGFYGEEICQIMRYAGLSDKLTSLGIYEINPTYDSHEQTTHLAAQMIWYFIDGYLGRFNEFPYKDKDQYVKYMVRIEGQGDEIIFYKSKRSDRWWMEVNCPPDMQVKYARHYLVPCSYSDYQTACENDIPDRWWQAYQKLM